MNSYFVFNWTIRLLWFFSPYALWSNSLQWFLQLLFVVSLSYSAFFFCYALWSVLLFKYRFLTFFTRYNTLVFCKKSYWIKLTDGRKSNVVRYIYSWVYLQFYSMFPCVIIFFIIRGWFVSSLIFLSYFH